MWYARRRRRAGAAAAAVAPAAVRRATPCGGCVFAVIVHRNEQLPHRRPSCAPRADLPCGRPAAASAAPRAQINTPSLPSSARVVHRRTAVLSAQTPERGPTMKPYPARKYRPVQPVDVARPAMAIARDHARADLVQRGSARRQPGADRADGRRAQAADVPAPGEDGLQGNRDRLSGGVADRLRLHAQADRRGADSRRRDGPGAHAIARGADRAHVRGARRREARHRPPVQLDVDDAAPPRVRPRPRRHQGDRGRGGEADPRLRGEAAGNRVVPRVLARELHRHRARLRGGGLRRGHGRLAADARSGRPFSTCRRPSSSRRRTSTPTRSSGCAGTSRAATASSCRCTRTTIAAAGSRRPSSR